MSAISSESRKAALRVLGIEDEQQLEVIAQLAKKTSVTSEEIFEKVPHRMLVIASIIESPDYLKLMQREMPFRLADNDIETIRQIYMDEIGRLTELPGFFEARKALRKRLQSQTSGGSGESGRTNDMDAIASVGGISVTPFLMGKKPPYLPVLKVIVSSEQNRVLWSEMLHWFDVLFVSRALLEQVSEHAEDSLDLLKTGMIVSMEQTQLREAFAKFRSTLDSLEKTLLTTETPSKD